MGPWAALLLSSAPIATPIYHIVQKAASQEAVCANLCHFIQGLPGAHLTGKQIDFALYPVITIPVCGFKIALIRQKGEDSLLLILNLRWSVN